MLESEVQLEFHNISLTQRMQKAKAHGNEPSKGAKIDAELQAEEEETINKKKSGKTDSMPGKKN